MRVVGRAGPVFEGDAVVEGREVSAGEMVREVGGGEAEMVFGGLQSSSPSSGRPVRCIRRSALEAVIPARSDDDSPNNSRTHPHDAEAERYAGFSAREA